MKKIVLYRASLALFPEKNEQIETPAKTDLGAFVAAQKTGLCGGSAACAAAPRPSNPLRSCGVRQAATACPKHPQGASIIPMIDTLSPILNL
jgi:hypothetical protein